jgi:hypothetical protein
MDNKEIKALQDKIEEALKVASKKMVEDKRRKNETMVVSVNGEIKFIKP